MQLSLSKLPWYAQIGAFVVVCVGAVVRLLVLLRARGPGRPRDPPHALDGAPRRRRRAAWRRRDACLSSKGRSRSSKDGSRASAPCCRKRRMSPTSCAASRAWPRSPACRFSASRRSRPCSRRCTRRCRSSSRPKGTYHNLGAFFDRISKFPRIINISSISIKANPKPEPNSTIIAECIATTFVLQEGSRQGKGKATVPKQPSLAK